MSFVDGEPDAQARTLSLMAEAEAAFGGERSEDDESEERIGEEWSRSIRPSPSPRLETASDAEPPSARSFDLRIVRSGTRARDPGRRARAKRR